MEYTVKELDDGTIEWYVGKKLHRENAPAVERPDGQKEWYYENKRHRVDGPAIEFADGYNKWFWEGKSVSEEEYNDIINPPAEEEEVVEERTTFTLDEVRDWLGETLVSLTDEESGLQTYVNSSSREGKNKPTTLQYVWLSALTFILAVLLAAEVYLFYISQL